MNTIENNGMGANNKQDEALIPAPLSPINDQILKYKFEEVPFGLIKAFTDTSYDHIKNLSKSEKAKFRNQRKDLKEEDFFKDYFDAEVSVKDFLNLFASPNADSILGFKALISLMNQDIELENIEIYSREDDSTSIYTSLSGSQLGEINMHLSKGRYLAHFIDDYSRCKINVNFSAEELIYYAEALFSESLTI
jgi:hypothetical protein